MKKVEFKQLAPYLPYGVNFNGLRKGWANPDVNYTLTLEDLKNDKYEIIKPILRPIDDLHKEIECNGESFRPIVKLFQLGAFRKWDDTAFNYFTQLHIELQNGELMGKDKKTKFIFSFENGCFNLLKREPRYEYCQLVNQLEMFQKLFEWHFDVFDLIPKGLAINKNTLQPCQ